MTTDVTTIEKVRKPREGRRSPRVAVDKAAMKRLRLVAVAYSHVKSEWFATPEAYQAEVAEKMFYSLPHFIIGSNRLRTFLLRWQGWDTRSHC